jgi:hypothetical protein
MLKLIDGTKLPAIYLIKLVEEPNGSKKSVNGYKLSLKNYG